jgi:hypothetical protein
MSLAVTPQHQGAVQTVRNFKFLSRFIEYTNLNDLNVFTSVIGSAAPVPLKAGGCILYSGIKIYPNLYQKCI